MLVQIILSCLFAFVFWYIYFSFVYFLNGGNVGRNQLTMVFELFREDILWNIPGGLKKKTEYIRNIVDNNEIGFLGDYTHEQIKNENLYEECAIKLIPSTLSFWSQTIIVPSFGFLIMWGIVNFFDYIRFYF